jgi:predicted phosphodiesterase
MSYLLLSDIHANLAAFEAVLADAGSYSEVWCLGDVVGYGPQPNECVELLRSLPHVCIAGNHDWAATEQLDISAFNPDAMQACLWTRSQLTPSSRTFIEELPERMVQGSFTLVHGSPRHPIWEYITHSSVAESNLDCFHTSVCLFGHTHKPVVYRCQGKQHACGDLGYVLDKSYTLDGGRVLLNPGGVGQPRDSDPRASYVLLDPEQQTAVFHRVDYPIEETQQLMLAAGLPSRLAWRLSVGW